jgi:hypothetical protein
MTNRLMYPMADRVNHLYREIAHTAHDFTGGFCRSAFTDKVVMDWGKSNRRSVTGVLGTEGPKPSA